MIETARLEELLAQRAVEGLAAGEEAELAALLAKHPDYDAEGFDRAAAAIALAALRVVEPLPAHLRERLEAAVERAPL